MSDYIVDSADLTSVANAIRTKGGTSEQLAFPAGFVSAVQAIPGGVTPTGTKQISITANGTTTEDVTNYASAEITVNVPSSGDYVADDWVKMAKPTGAITITSSGGQPPAYSLYGRTGITEVNLPNATSLAKNGLNGLKGNYVLNAPNVTGVNTTAISDSTGLRYLVLPKATYVNANGNSTGVTSNLLGVDLGGTPTSSGLGTYAFQNHTKLATIVLRSNSVWKLSAINSLSNTLFASGKAGGTLYVPQAMIASYQAATNWSTILGYGSGAQNSIQAIEGSIYETAYADGTPCPQSITNTLTNVTSSNTDTSVVAGEAYSATLTADAGYTISSVTVMMKRVDVTSTVYNSSTGVISIVEVNGPIIITATAT